MSISFEFSAEKYRKLPNDEARKAFKILMFAMLEADAEAADKAEAAALVAAAQAEKTATEQEKENKKIREKQEAFLERYPDGYIYLRNNDDVISLRDQAYHHHCHIKTFVENVLGQGLIKAYIKKNKL